MSNVVLTKNARRIASGNTVDLIGSAHAVRCAFLGNVIRNVKLTSSVNSMHLAVVCNMAEKFVSSRALDVTVKMT